MKIRVAKYAISLTRDGIVLGVGTGSTAMYFFRELSELIKKGKLKNIRIVPTSTEVEYYAKILGVEKFVVQPWQIDSIDIAIDGADEVDNDRNLVKGGGGALTGEKIVDYNSRELYIIVDERKLVRFLGEKVEIPIEVIAKYWNIVSNRILREFGGDIRLRILEKGKRGPLVTDYGGYILDWKRILNDIDPQDVEIKIKSIPGVVEVGIFSGKYVTKVIVCDSTGKIIEF